MKNRFVSIIAKLGSASQEGLWGYWTFKRVVAVAVVSCFTVSFIIRDTAYSFVQDSRSGEQFKGIMDDVVIPQTAGKVTGARYYDSDKVVINIQDLHCHPEVQRNIARILSALDREFKLSAVFVEGASGAVNTSWLSDIKDQDLRKELVEGLVDEGKLTGAEYYSITAHKPELISGLEDQQLYKENLARLKKILDREVRYGEVIRSMRVEIEGLKTRHFSRRNRKFEGILVRNRDGKLNAEKYYRLLLKYADKLNNGREDDKALVSIDPASYANIAGYLELIERGKHLDYARIGRQLQGYIALLKQQIPYSVYSSLLEKTDNFQKLDELYIYLSRLSREYRIDLSQRYPQLEQFFAYLEKSQQVNPLELVKEERRLVEEIRAGLSGTTDELEVSFLADFLTYYEDYLTNRLSAEDYEYFTRRIGTFTSLWAKYSGHDLAEAIRDDQSTLDEFYRVNVERNDRFLSNTIQDYRGKDLAEAGPLAGRLDAASLKKAGEVIVFITGGFHTQGLEKLLDARKISHIAITPNVTQGTGTSSIVYAEVAKQQAKILSQMFAPVLESMLAGLALHGQDSRSDGWLLAERALLEDTLRTFEKHHQDYAQTIEKLFAEESFRKQFGTAVSVSPDAEHNGALLLAFKIGEKAVVFRYQDSQLTIVSPVLKGVPEEGKSVLTKPETYRAARRITEKIGLYITDEKIENLIAPVIEAPLFILASFSDKFFKGLVKSHAQGKGDAVEQGTIVVIQATRMGALAGLTAAFAGAFIAVPFIPQIYLLSLIAVSPIIGALTGNIISHSLWNQGQNADDRERIRKILQLWEQEKWEEDRLYVRNVRTGTEEQLALKALDRTNAAELLDTLAVQWGDEGRSIADELSDNPFDDHIMFALSPEGGIEGVARYNTDFDKILFCREAPWNRDADAQADGEYAGVEEQLFFVMLRAMGIPGDSVSEETGYSNISVLAGLPDMRSLKMMSPYLQDEEIRWSGQEGGLTWAPSQKAVFVRFVMDQKKTMLENRGVLSREGGIEQGRRSSRVRQAIAGVVIANLGWLAVSSRIAMADPLGIAAIAASSILCLSIVFAVRKWYSRSRESEDNAYALTHPQYWHSLIGFNDVKHMIVSAGVTIVFMGLMAVVPSSSATLAAASLGALSFYALVRGIPWRGAMGKVLADSEAIKRYTSGKNLQTFLRRYNSPFTPGSSVQDGDADLVEKLLRSEFSSSLADPEQRRTIIQLLRDIDPAEKRKIIDHYLTADKLDAAFDSTFSGFEKNVLTVFLQEGDAETYQALFDYYQKNKEDRQKSMEVLHQLLSARQTAPREIADHYKTLLPDLQSIARSINDDLQRNATLIAENHQDYRQLRHKDIMKQADRLMDLIQIMAQQDGRTLPFLSDMLRDRISWTSNMRSKVMEYLTPLCIKGDPRALSVLGMPALVGPMIQLMRRPSYQQLVSLLKSDAVEKNHRFAYLVLLQHSKDTEIIKKVALDKSQQPDIRLYAIMLCLEQGYDPPAPVMEEMTGLADRFVRDSLSDPDSSARIRELFDNVILQNEEAKVFITALTLAMQRAKPLLKDVSLKMVFKRIAAASLYHDMMNANSGFTFGGAFIKGRVDVIRGFYTTISHELMHNILNAQYLRLSLGGRLATATLHEFISDVYAFVFAERFDPECRGLLITELRYGSAAGRVKERNGYFDEEHQGARAELMAILQTFRALEADEKVEPLNMELLLDCSLRYSGRNIPGASVGITEFRDAVAAIMDMYRAGSLMDQSSIEEDSREARRIVSRDRRRIDDINGKKVQKVLSKDEIRELLLRGPLSIFDPFIKKVFPGDEKNRRYLFITAGIVPVIEETVFRFFPAVLVGQAALRSLSLADPFGITQFLAVSVIVFAFAHIIVRWTARAFGKSGGAGVVRKSDLKDLAAYLIPSVLFTAVYAGTALIVPISSIALCAALFVSISTHAAYNAAVLSKLLPGKVASLASGLQEGHPGSAGELLRKVYPDKQEMINELAGLVPDFEEMQTDGFEDSALATAEGLETTVRLLKIAREKTEYDDRYDEITSKWHTLGDIHVLAPVIKAVQTEQESGYQMPVLSAEAVKKNDCLCIEAPGDKKERGELREKFKRYQHEFLDANFAALELIDGHKEKGLSKAQVESIVAYLGQMIDVLEDFDPGEGRQARKCLNRLMEKLEKDNRWTDCPESANLPDDLRKEVAVPHSWQSFKDVTTIHSLINAVHTIGDRALDRTLDQANANLLLIEGTNRVTIANLNESPLISGSGDVISRPFRQILTVFEALSFINRQDKRFVIVDDHAFCSFHLGIHSLTLSVDLSSPDEGGGLRINYFEGSEQDKNKDRKAYFKRILESLGVYVKLDAGADHNMLEAILDKEHGAADASQIEKALVLSLRAFFDSKNLDHVFQTGRSSHHGDKAERAREVVENAADIFLAEGRLPLYDRYLELSYGEYEKYLSEGKAAERKDLLERLNTRLDRCGLPRISGEKGIYIGQRLIEEQYSRAMRGALARKEIYLDGNGEPQRNPAYHPVNDLLEKVERNCDGLMQTAATINTADDTLFRFSPIGSAGRLTVVRSERELDNGQWIVVFGLQEPVSRRLLFASASLGTLHGSREEIDAAELAGTLNHYGCQVKAAGRGTISRFESVRARELLRSKPVKVSERMLPVQGMTSSSGFGTWEMGRVSFDRKYYRQKGQVPGKTVFITPFTTPDDIDAIRNAAAVVTTGGGMLTHAAITTREYDIKSVIVPDASWRRHTGAVELRMSSLTPDRRYDSGRGMWIAERIKAGDISVREGDVVLVNSDDGTLVSFPEESRAALRELFALLEGIETGARPASELTRWFRDHSAYGDAVLGDAMEFLLLRTMNGALKNEKVYARDIAPLLDRLSGNEAVRERISRFKQNVAAARQEEWNTFCRMMKDQSKHVSGSSTGAWCGAARREIRQRTEEWKTIAGILDVPGALPDTAEMEGILEQTTERAADMVISESTRLMNKGPDTGDLPALRRLQRISDGITVKDARLAASLAPARGSLKKEIQRLSAEKQERISGKIVYSLDEIDEDYTPVTGGKASKLGEIQRTVKEKGSYVPRGIAVTTGAFGRFLKETGTETEYQSLLKGLDRSLDRLQRYDEKEREAKRRVLIEQYSVDIRRLIASAQLPENSALVREIFDALGTAGSAQGPWAVRSSAIQEDTDDAAFAGAAETYLYVDREDLVDHIRQCWMSFWLPRGIEYRYRQDILAQEGLEDSAGSVSRQQEFSPAVLVQEMVDAETAGVAFTMHPVSGSDEVVINAAYGLGEAVVSNSTDADMFTARKTDGEETSLPYIGSKRIQIVRSADGKGVETVAVNRLDRKTRCLTPEQVEKVARLAAVMEDRFGYPLDIEFAFHNGQPVILQARPITMAVEKENDAEGAEEIAEPFTEQNRGMIQKLHDAYTFDADSLARLKKNDTDHSELAKLLEERCDSLIASARSDDERAKLAQVRGKIPGLIWETAPNALESMRGMNIQKGVFIVMISWLKRLLREKSGFRRVYIARDAGMLHALDHLISGDAEASSVYYMSRDRLGQESAYKAMKGILQAMKDDGIELTYPEVRRRFIEKCKDQDFKAIVDEVRHEMIDKLGYNPRGKILFVDTGFKGHIPLFLKNCLDYGLTEAELIDKETGEERVQIALMEPDQSSKGIFKGFTRKDLTDKGKRLLKETAGKIDHRLQYLISQSPGQYAEKTIEAHPIKYDAATGTIAGTDAVTRFEMYLEQMVCMLCCLELENGDRQEKKEPAARSAGSFLNLLQVLLLFGGKAGNGSVPSGVPMVRPTAKQDNGLLPRLPGEDPDIPSFLKQVYSCCLDKDMLRSLPALSDAESSKIKLGEMAEELYGRLKKERGEDGTLRKAFDDIMNQINGTERVRITDTADPEHPVTREIPLLGKAGEKTAVYYYGIIADAALGFDVTGRNDRAIYFARDGGSAYLVRKTAALLRGEEAVFDKRNDIVLLSRNSFDESDDLYFDMRRAISDLEDAVDRGKGSRDEATLYERMFRTMKGAEYGKADKGVMRQAEGIVDDALAAALRGGKVRLIDSGREGVLTAYFKRIAIERLLAGNEGKSILSRLKGAAGMVDGDAVRQAADELKNLRVSLLFADDDPRDPRNVMTMNTIKGCVDYRKKIGGDEAMAFHLCENIDQVFELQAPGSGAPDSAAGRIRYTDAGTQLRSLFSMLLLAAAAKEHTALAPRAGQKDVSEKEMPIRGRESSMPSESIIRQPLAAPLFSIGLVNILAKGAQKIALTKISVIGLADIGAVIVLSLGGIIAVVIGSWLLMRQNKDQETIGDHVSQASGQTKIHLVGITSGNQPNSSITTALYTLAGNVQAYFKKNGKGDEVRTFTHDMYMDHSLTTDSIARSIADEGADIVSLSIVSGSLPNAEEIIGKLKEELMRRGVPEERFPQIVIGNTMPTFAPDEELKEYLTRFPGAVAVKGEGEMSLIRLAEWVRGEGKKSQIPGITYLENGELEKTPPLTMNLEDLSSPDFAPIVEYMKKNGPGFDIYIETSRGCPHGACYFCPRGPQKKWRSRPVANVLNDIESLVSAVCRDDKLTRKMDAVTFNFADEEFLNGKKDGLERAREIAEGIIKISEKYGKDIQFHFSSRADSIWSEENRNDKDYQKLRDETLLTLKKAGMIKLFLGIESGSGSQLERYNKGCTIEDNKKAIETLRRLGINFEMGLIMFDPLVTLKEIRENIQFINDTDSLDNASWFLNELRLQAKSMFTKGRIADRLGLELEKSAPRTPAVYDRVLRVLWLLCIKLGVDVDKLNPDRLTAYDHFLMTLQYDEPYQNREVQTLLDETRNVFNDSTVMVYALKSIKRTMAAMDPTTKDIGIKYLGLFMREFLNEFEGFVAILQKDPDLSGAGRGKMEEAKKAAYQKQIQLTRELLEEMDKKGEADLQLVRSLKESAGEFLALAHKRIETIPQKRQEKPAQLHDRIKNLPVRRIGYSVRRTARESIVEQAFPSLLKPLGLVSSLEQSARMIVDTDVVPADLREGALCFIDDNGSSFMRQADACAARGIKTVIISREGNDEYMRRARRETIGGVTARVVTEKGLTRVVVDADKNGFAEQALAAAGNISGTLSGHPGLLAIITTGDDASALSRAGIDASIPVIAEGTKDMAYKAGSGNHVLIQDINDMAPDSFIGMVGDEIRMRRGEAVWRGGEMTFGFNWELIRNCSGEIREMMRQANAGNIRIQGGLSELEKIVADPGALQIIRSFRDSGKKVFCEVTLKDLGSDTKKVQDILSRFDGWEIDARAAAGVRPEALAGRLNNLAGDRSGYAGKKITVLLPEGMTREQVVVDSTIQIVDRNASGDQYVKIEVENGFQLLDVMRIMKDIRAAGIEIAFTGNAANAGVLREIGGRLVWQIKETPELVYGFGRGCPVEHSQDLYAELRSAMGAETAGSADAIAAWYDKKTDNGKRTDGSYFFRKLGEFVSQYREAGSDGTKGRKIEMLARGYGENILSQEYLKRNSRRGFEKEEDRLAFGKVLWDLDSAGMSAGVDTGKIVRDILTKKDFDSAAVEPLVSPAGQYAGYVRQAREVIDQESLNYGEVVTRLNRIESELAALRSCDAGSVKNTAALLAEFRILDLLSNERMKFEVDREHNRILDTKATLALLGAA